MPSSPLPLPTTDSPTATISPQAPPSTTPEAVKEAKKIASLHAKISALSAQIAATQAQIDAIKPQLKSPSPETTVKQHIALLHTYNEIRDVGQGLLGMVAENRGVRIRDVYGEFGVAEGD
ncbi:hypothetical protein MMC17_001827 [Xylographa soralifera]|nr:hypothetical protein [Xylographa soralifera]